MKVRMLGLAMGTVGIVSLPAHGGVLYDNGPVNGVNGYSNATSGVFGARRTLLDDFIVPAGGWTLQDIQWRSVWGTLGPIGSGIDLSVRSDVAGSPGDVVAVTNTIAYSEIATGNIYFSREETLHWAQFSDIVLGAGHYWFEATIVPLNFGAENNFWLTADQRNNECWVNYDDLGGLQSGTDQFGVASDLNFILGGVPAPGAAVVLLAGLFRRRRDRTPSRQRPRVRSARSQRPSPHYA